ncbi:MAG: urease accessory protein UreE [Halobacteriales archaeon]
MIVAEEILGRLSEYADGRRVERVVLGHEERKRSRIRTTTDDGTEIGLVLGEATPGEGDVVYADEERAIAVSVREREALVVDLSGVEAEAGVPASLVELGHAVGNRHLDLAVRDGDVLLPADEAGEAVEATVRPHLPSAATVRREQVDPALFDDAEGPGHAHGDDHAHAGGGHRPSRGER